MKWNTSRMVVTLSKLSAWFIDMMFAGVIKVSPSRMNETIFWRRLSPSVSYFTEDERNSVPSVKDVSFFS